jgi:hypothetical protein
MTQHNVKDKPYPFSGSGHSMSWRCIRCDKVRPILGSQQRRYAGQMRKVCAECVKEMP